MKPSEALEVYRDTIRRHAKAHRASHERVFGSVLHCEDTEESDIDLLVDPTSETSLMDSAAIQGKLEKQWGVAVDVLAPNALPDKLSDVVLAEAVRV